MFGYGMYGYYYDPTYMLVFIGAIITLIASGMVKTTYAKYERVRNMRGMTGKEAAEMILRNEGLHDVRVQHVSGNLSDHYNPSNKTVNLSDSTYGSASVAAVAVAAHECGHALQHAHSYAPLSMRTAILPIANLGSKLAWPLIFFGLFFTGNSSATMLNLGVMAFSFAVLFQLVTLPVEFNASSRALKLLGNYGILENKEVSHGRKVLNAAAMTYVAAAAAALLQLLRIVLIAQRRNND